MRLTRLVMALLACAPLVRATAQIPTSRTTAKPAGSAAPRLLVSTPYTYATQDSSAAVQIGDGLRVKMEKVVGTNYFVIPRAQMNEALAVFTYPADAILAPNVQKIFATSLQARFMLASALARSPQGQFSVTARFAGLNEEAGNTIVMAQPAGQTFPAFGGALADAFSAAVKSMADARECMGQRVSAPDKAIGFAKKALATMPNSGIAHFCLAQISLDKKTKPDSAEAMKQLQAAVAGDQLSLPAWTQLAGLYEIAGDTAKTVEALQQMLLVAPGNQPLREQAFKLFIKYERPAAAEQAALDGLKLDPTNADLWDLLSNARVYKGDYKGAVDALEQVVANDSAKVDSTFLLKITVMASQQPDTVRLLKWARYGVNKYPRNQGLLLQLLTAYTLAGPLDSAVAVSNRVIAADSTQVAVALEISQALNQAKRGYEALPFEVFAAGKGDATSKENAAALMLNGALPLIQADPDKALALLRGAVANATPTGKVAPISNFYLGLLVLQQVPKIDPEAEKQKSCDLATKEQGLLAEAGKALQLGSTYKPEDAAKYLKYVEGYKPRVASMLKAFCK